MASSTALTVCTRCVDEGLAAAEVQLALIVPEWENVLAERARLSAVAWAWREVETGLPTPGPVNRRGSRFHSHEHRHG